MQSLLNYIPNGLIPKFLISQSQSKIIKGDEDLPDHFDARVKWSGCVHQVLD